MSGGKLGGECSSGAWKEVWAETEWIWDLGLISKSARGWSQLPGLTGEASLF